MKYYSLFDILNWNTLSKRKVQIDIIASTRVQCCTSEYQRSVPVSARQQCYSTNSNYCNVIQRTDGWTASKFRVIPAKLVSAIPKKRYRRFYRRSPSRAIGLLFIINVARCRLATSLDFCDRQNHRLYRVARLQHNQLD